MLNSSKKNETIIDRKREAIGQRIARLRKEKGLTQTELAEMVGISQKLVCAYEIGHNRIHAEMLYRFAVALKVSADEIIGIESKHIEKPPSLRAMRRMRQIDNLPENKRKLILKMIDDLIRANT